MSPKTAIITGASRGLGSRIALAAADSGYDLGLICLSDMSSLEQTASACRQSGVRILYQACDVRSLPDIERFFNRIVAEFGHIDLLINNAALSSSKLVAGMSPDEFNALIETNLTGVRNCIKTAARHMMKRRSGHIINIGSLSALAGIAGGSAYSASKCALAGLTQTTAAELGRFNVKVNLVMPGYMPTDMTQGLSDDKKTTLAGANLLGRPSTFSEICAFILHLADMHNVSGQIFNLDSRIRPWR